MNTISNEKKWLVKSENKILGPYSFDQVEDLLLKKQISIIDEIRDTETRWLYIRENLEFQSVIGNIRQQLDNKSEATKTVQSGQSQTGTKPTDDYLQSTKSSANYFTDVSLTTQEASVVKETVDDIVARAQRDDALEKKNQSRKFVFQNDPASQKEMRFFAKNVKVTLLIVFVLSLSGIFSFYFYNKYNEQRVETELLTQVKKLKFLGLGQQAAVLFSQLNPTSQKKFFKDVIDLYPYLESFGFQIKNLDDLESSANLSTDNKINIYMSRFWAFMQVQNFEQAQVQVVKAKSLQPADALVNENDAILNLRLGKYTVSLESFLKLYDKNMNGRFLFGAIQCFQALNQTDQFKYAADLEKFVDRHVATRYDYRKELLLVQMAFALYKNNDILFRLSWKQFLNTPTQLSVLFKKPTLVAPFSYQWKDLETYISVVRKKLNRTDDMVFQVHDYLESSQISAAVDFVEKNKNSFADAASRQQMYLLVYNALNKRNEILSLSKTNQLDKKSELNHLIIGLSKVLTSTDSDVSEHIDFLNQNNLKFYADWISLMGLVQKRKVADIKFFLKSNYMIDTDFIPAEEARSLLD